MTDRIVDYPGVNPYTLEPQTLPCLVVSENPTDGTITGVVFDESGDNRLVSFVPESVREQREADEKDASDLREQAGRRQAAQDEQDRKDLETFRAQQQEGRQDRSNAESENDTEIPANHDPDATAAAPANNSALGV